jgi:hypothetical protein
MFPRPDCTKCRVFAPPCVKLIEGWGTKLTRVLSRVFRTVANGDFNVCCLMLPCSRLVSVFIEDKTISMTRSVKNKEFAIVWFGGFRMVLSEKRLFAPFRTFDLKQHKSKVKRL